MTGERILRAYKIEPSLLNFQNLNLEPKLSVDALEEKIKPQIFRNIVCEAESCKNTRKS